MSHQDRMSDIVINHETIKQAVDWLLPPLLFVRMKVRKGATWSARMLAVAALLWATSDRPTLTSRFDHARKIVKKMFRWMPAPGATYQGFMKVLRKWHVELMLAITPYVQTQMKEVLPGQWGIAGYVVFAGDGSRVELAWRDEKALRLPPQIDCFEERQLNRDRVPQYIEVENIIPVYKTVPHTNYLPPGNRHVGVPHFGRYPRSRFTDDSVLTVAVAEVLASGGNYTDSIQRWARAYPRAGYGGAFRKWMWSEAARPYGSFGNGSGMRASPVGWARTSLEEALAEARRSAEVTHDHPEGIKGAQAVAAAVFLARTGSSKDEIRSTIATRLGYDLSRRLDDLRAEYTFDVTCQGSVPEALIAFLESSGWEDAVRRAISLGGDADTLACMTGAVAEAFYGDSVVSRLERETAAGGTVFRHALVHKSKGTELARLRTSWSAV